MVRITMEDGGVIDIELNEEAAPLTCENFKKLVGQGFYNGLTFHRGKVVAGMDVVDKIAAVATDWNDKPKTPVRMKTVELIEG